MMEATPAPGVARLSAARVSVLAAIFLVAVGAAAGFPLLDRLYNPDATQPGLISFLGVGLTVLVFTTGLLLVGLRRLLPRTAVFFVAALGYNAMLIGIKFGLGPMALYSANARISGFTVLNSSLAYPGLAAITAILYGGGFFVLYLVFRARVQRSVGVKLALGKAWTQLFVGMFVVAAVGVVTGFGLFGFLEYALSIFFWSVMGFSIAAALILAIAFCSVAFNEAAEQAVMLRNVTMLSTFAWIGLAFIAAYHILWLVFLLTLISLWPLKATK